MGENIGEILTSIVTSIIVMVVVAGYIISALFSLIIQGIKDVVVFLYRHIFLQPIRRYRRKRKKGENEPNKETEGKEHIVADGAGKPILIATPMEQTKQT